MFTSKKAQYLDKDFNNVSPITNIDSVYFEQIEGASGTEYVVNRMSVAKHMPIQYHSEDLEIGNRSNIGAFPTGQYIQDIYVANFQKNILTNINQFNPNTGKYKYQNDLFEVNVDFVNLTDLLNHYASLDYFDASINQVDSSVMLIQPTIEDVCINMNYIESRYNDLSTRLYSNNYIRLNGNSYVDITISQPVSLETNCIYNLAYPEKYSNPYFYIKVQCISTGNIQQFISMDTIKSKTNDTLYVEKWQFHYDTELKRITYLKDEYGNEGNFDFRYTIINNQKNIFGKTDGSVNNVSNNIIYLENPQNSSIYIQEYSYNNKIYNSLNINIGDNENFTSDNEIRNVNNLVISDSISNKIINSSNYVLDITDGNNNTIINCNDCSIKINGNNNILINLKNQDINLSDNNIIIGDEIGCPTNQITLKNDRLFLNYSSSTAIALDLSTYCTVFGGIGNDVSVYSSGYSTTNK